MVEKDQGVGFRLSIKKTGCSGYSYLPRIIDAIVNMTDSDLPWHNGCENIY